jgi:hypothetical protein
MEPEWIIAGCAVLTIAGALVAVLYKFSVGIDRLTVAFVRIEKIVEKFDANFNDHGNRIIKLESWRESHHEFHESSGRG